MLPPTASVIADGWREICGCALAVEKINVKNVRIKLNADFINPFLKVVIYLIVNSAINDNGSCSCRTAVIREDSVSSYHRVFG